MFKKLAKQLKQTTFGSKENSNVTLPFLGEFLEPKSDFLNKLSQNALKLYERENDLKKFSQLALSNPENTSHNELVNKLFKDGVADPFVDDKLAQLADNEKLLKDLGLL